MKRSLLLFLMLLLVIVPRSRANDPLMVRPTGDVFQDINFPAAHPFKSEGVTILFGNTANKVPILNGSGYLPASIFPPFTGDVTSPGGSLTLTIGNSTVTLAKMANIATGSFLGRNTAGAGAPEVLSISTAKTMLNLSGTNTGDQTITLTGDVTGSGTGSFSATIGNSTVTLAKMANMATASLIYRKTAGTGAPEVNSLATLKTDLGLTGTNSGDQTITLTGDVTGTGTGSFAATIGNSTVTLAKMANMATSSLIYRKTAGTGAPEVNSLATLKTDLGLTGTNSGDQTITLTGDVTGSGTGSFSATIGNSTVTLAKMANMATASFLGRNTAGTGVPEVLSIATAKTMLNLSGTNSGDQTITLTGDVTGSGTGSFGATIGNSTVTLAKMADMATASLIYRKTAGTGAPEVNSLATLKTDLGLTGTNSGDQTITLTGDVTGTGTGSFSATIGNSTVTLAKMANMATSSLIYRKTAGTGAPEVNTLATLKTDLGLTGTNSGDQTITLTGDVTGSGTGSFAATLPNIVTAGTNPKVTYNAKGQVTAGTTLGAGDIPGTLNATTFSGDITLAPAKYLTPGSYNTDVIRMNGDGNWTVGGYNSGSNYRMQFTYAENASVTNFDNLRGVRFLDRFTGLVALDSNLDGTNAGDHTIGVVGSYSPNVVFVGDSITQLVANLAASKTVTTTNGSATITFTAGVITDKDVGSAISGTGIPASTYIGSLLSSTSATLSSWPLYNIGVSATASGSITATVTPYGYNNYMGAGSGDGVGAVPAIGTYNALAVAPTVGQNVGVAGYTIQQIAERAYLFNSKFRQESGMNIAVVLAGTNNLPTETPAQVYSELEAFCKHLRQNGWRVIVVGLISRGNGAGSAPVAPNSGQTWDQLVGAVNAYSRQNWAQFADRFVDWGVIGSGTNEFNTGGYSNTTYYSTDQLHPTYAGHRKLAGYVNAAVNDLLTYYFQTHRNQFFVNMNKATHTNVATDGMLTLRNENPVAGQSEINFSFSNGTTYALKANIRADYNGTLNFGATGYVADYIGSTGPDVYGTTGSDGPSLIFYRDSAKVESFRPVRVTSNSGAGFTTGKGLEFNYSSSLDYAFITAYDQTTPAWKPLLIQASTTKFATGGTDRVLIDSGGITVTGSVSATGSNGINLTHATAAYHVGNWTNTGGQGGFSFQESGTQKGAFQMNGSAFSDSSRQLWMEFVNTSSGGISFWTSTTQRLDINNNGTLRARAYGAGTLTTDASGNITASSDATLKNIDGNFTRGSIDLLGIQPKLFHWKKESGLDTTEQYAGPIAQDVLSFVPEAVGLDPAGKHTLSDHVLVATLINATNEHTTTLRKMQAQIDALAAGNESALKAQPPPFRDPVDRKATQAARLTTLKTARDQRKAADDAARKKAPAVPPIPR